MAIITKIETQVKNVDRCNLFIDGEFYCGLSKIVVLKNQLKVNSEITKSEIDSLVFESDKDKAFNWAIDYVCKYLPVEKQLRNKLYEKGYITPIVNYVLDKCKEYGYIDDLKYAESYVYQNKNIKGKLKIKVELQAKGISQENIQQALDQYEENDGCLELAKKHCKNKDVSDPKYLVSLSRYLQYRGYGYDEVKRAIDSIKKGDDFND